MKLEKAKSLLIAYNQSLVSADEANERVDSNVLWKLTENIDRLRPHIENAQKAAQNGEGEIEEEIDVDLYNIDPRNLPAVEPRVFNTIKNEQP